LLQKPSYLLSRDPSRAAFNVPSTLAYVGESSLELSPCIAPHAISNVQVRVATMWNTVFSRHNTCCMTENTPATDTPPLPNISFTKITQKNEAPAITA